MKFVLFKLFITALYVEPIFARVPCYQGIHGTVPNELARKLSEKYGITVNAEMAIVPCLHQLDNPNHNNCLMFACNGSNNFIFNTCNLHPELNFCRDEMVHYCSNGRVTDCKGCFGSYCNSDSLPAQLRKLNKPIPVNDNQTYFPIECIDCGNAAGYRIYSVATSLLIAMLIAGRFALFFLSFRLIVS
ncbi:hypothetical protein GPALN_002318 [Globodera pallida]|nr:hypothetical protein GPALN_002318 [Globodera pallida]